MSENGNGNGKNGLFLKVLIGLCVALSASAAVGGIVLYGDVRELKKGNDLERRFEVLERRFDGLEARVTSIDADRHKRTEYIKNNDADRAQFKSDFADIRAQLRQLERRR